MTLKSLFCVNVLRFCYVYISCLCICDVIMVVITYLYYTISGLSIFIHVHGVMFPSDMMPCVKTCFPYVLFVEVRHETV